MNQLRLPFTLILLCAGFVSYAQLADPEGQRAQAQRQATAQTAMPKAETNAKLTYLITDAPNGTFGYDILSDGKLIVRQLNIPGQPGNSGCATKADAERLAQLVIEKIRNGAMPPTVTREELKGLNIVK